MIKKVINMKTIGAFLILFLLYIIIGACVPFIKQPNVTDVTVDRVNKTDFYGDEYTSERVHLLVDNGDALKERIRMIEQAEEKIILSTFQFYADHAGKAMMSSLINAANRGVEVQIIIDGVTEISQFTDKKYFLALAETDNVEIKVYNPISALRPWSINGRLHDKYLIVDNELYILGGRNIFGFFLGDKSDHKNIDWDVLVYNTSDTLGQSTEQLLEYFDEIWNSEYNKVMKNKMKFINKRSVNKAREELESIYLDLVENYPEWLQEVDYYPMTVAVKNIELLVNPITPYSKEPVVFYTITQLMEEAEEDVVFHTPYIIANDWMLERLERVCLSVPSVTMMTNSVANNGNPFGAVDYKQHKGEILETGVKILEYDSGVSYHGKCFVIDDRLSSVGAFNWDMRSTYIDTETMLVIDSEDFKQELRQAMKVYEEQALEVVDKDTSIVPEGHEVEKTTFKGKVLMAFAAVLKVFFRFLF